MRTGEGEGERPHVREHPSPQIVMLKFVCDGMCGYTYTEYAIASHVCDTAALRCGVSLTLRPKMRIEVTNTILN